MKKALHIIAFWFFSFSSYGQNFSRFEYYFDSDPGLGNANSLTFPVGNDIDFLANITSVNLTAGLHWLNVRAKVGNSTTFDLTNRWSVVFTKAFYVFPYINNINLGTGVVKAEYFWNTDLGFGNCQNLTLTAGNDISPIFALNVPNILNGINILGFRVQSDNGQWSSTSAKIVYVLKGNAQGQASNLIAAEYFIDTDAGFGNNTQIPITNLGSLNELMFPITIPSNLSVGIHTIGVRVKSQIGDWSSTSIKTIYVLKGNAQGQASNLTAAEYFIDTDAGFGNNTQIPITNLGSLNELMFPITIPSNLSVGIHTIGVRAKSQIGDWSACVTNTFVVLPTSTPDIYVNKIEYFIDNIDPGVGLATNIPFSPLLGRNVIGNLTLNLTGLSTGLHFLKFRTQDTESNWSIAYQLPFEIVVVPCPDNLTISNTNTLLGGLGQATQTINATNAIMANQKIEFRAGNLIQLNSGFEAKTGSVFTVLVGGCL